MIGLVLDLRVLGPALLAAVVFAAHEHCQPAATPIPAPRGQPLTLPQPLAWAGPAADTGFELDARGANVRFRVDTGLRRIDAVCPASSGQLRFGVGGRPTELSLRFCLVTLQAPDGGKTGEEVSRLLGLRRDEEIAFHGTLVAHETFATAGVARTTFAGTLTLGTRRRQQSMQLWLALLLPGRVRLQGLGTVDGHDLGLPRRRYLGFFPEQCRVTVGLDLPFLREDR